MTKISMAELQKNYDKENHFHIPCNVSDNPNLNKLLTGEGARVARELYPEYVSLSAEMTDEDRFQLYKIARKLNDNPDIILFTCVTTTNMQMLRVEAWGTEELMTAANLLGENGTTLLGFLTNEQR